MAQGPRLPADGRRQSSAEVIAGAAKAVNDVLTHNRTIDWVQNNREKWVASAAANAMLFGTLRHVFTLQQLIDRHLQKPLRRKDSDVYCLMLVGAYQLVHSQNATHAVLNETVEAIKVLRKPWAKGLVNAVLRTISRQSAPPEDTDQSFDHPVWLASMLRAQYPLQWVPLLQANNQPGPMTLRVNLQKITLSQYAQRLSAAGIDARPAGSCALVLGEPLPAASLPGWEEGWVAVQDRGAQYAAEILHNAISLHAATVSSPGSLRFLDACAAPGGKLAHLLELVEAGPLAATGMETLAVDVSAARLATTTRLLARLGHHPDLIEGDVTGLAWWDGRPFHYILLDAPCSGTGTIRRHPDIKVLLHEESIEQHSRQQLEMLHNLWRTLAPGGTLLYCTCSLLGAENDEVISRFLASSGDHADVLEIHLPTGAATRHGWQLLPTDPDTDGFYYALLRRP